MPYPPAQPHAIIKTLNVTPESGIRSQLGNISAHLNSQMVGLSINNHPARVIPSNENNSRIGAGSNNCSVNSENSGSVQVNLGNNISMNGVISNFFKNDNINNGNGIGTEKETNYRTPKWGYPVTAIPANIIHAQNSVLPINAVPVSSSTQIPMCYIRPSLPPQAASATTPTPASVVTCLPSYPSNLRQDLNLMYQHSPGPKSNLVLLGSQMPSNPSNICSFQTLPIQTSPTIQSIPQLQQGQSQANHICSTNLPQPSPQVCNNGIISSSPHYPYAINHLSMPSNPSQIGNGATFIYRHQIQVSSIDLSLLS